LCVVVSFLARGKKPIYVYLDSHEDDDGRIVSEVRRQLLPDDTMARVSRFKS
jgi:hypothetical protein